MVAGGVVLFTGVVSLTGITADTTSSRSRVAAGVHRPGAGPAQNLFSLVIQNAAPTNQIGVATSMSQFSRQMGSTVGVAIFGTLPYARAHC